METKSADEVDAVLSKTNALLFYQLARFVVWGQQHKNLLVSNQEFGELLGDATKLLASPGIAIDR